jgi:transposase
LETQLEPVLAEAQAETRHVFFVDAAHFVLGAWLGSLWCLARVLLPTPSGRQRFNVLGALHAITHEIVTVTNETYINSTSVVELFEKLATRFKDHPITVVLDNARYQRNHLVMAEAERLHITLLWLPTYSPNLNLIERLWKLVKAECLHGRYYPSFKPFKEAIMKTLENQDSDFQHKLTSLLTLKFQLFDNAA